jgi:hypothetical protein
MDQVKQESDFSTQLEQILGDDFLEALSDESSIDESQIISQLRV